jgi:hypothetical protein
MVETVGITPSAVVVAGSSLWLFGAAGREPFRGVAFAMAAGAVAGPVRRRRLPAA